jgi:hypothetical protein
MIGITAAEAKASRPPATGNRTGRPVVQVALLLVATLVLTAPAAAAFALESIAQVGRKASQG